MTASKFATAAVAAAALVFAAGPAAAQQNIRTATSWPGGVHLEQFAQGFSKQVDSITGGKVKFQVFPAGTIGSPLKITESVQKKVAQAGHSWPGYDWGLDKTAAVFGGYVGSPPARPRPSRTSVPRPHGRVACISSSSPRAFPSRSIR